MRQEISSLDKAISLLKTLSLDYVCSHKEMDNNGNRGWIVVINSPTALPGIVKKEFICCSCKDQELTKRYNNCIEEALKAKPIEHMDAMVMDSKYSDYNVKAEQARKKWLSMIEYIEYQSGFEMIQDENRTVIRLKEMY